MLAQYNPELDRQQRRQAQEQGLDALSQSAVFSLSAKDPDSKPYANGNGVHSNGVHSNGDVEKSAY